MDRSGLDPVRRRLLDLMESRGVSLRAASEALGRNPAYLHQFIYKASPRALREKERVALAAMLGVAETVLMTEDQRSVADLLRRPSPAPPGRGGKLPVLGYARGGSDVMTINPEAPMGEVDAPPGIAGVPDAYAVEVVGDSHEPRLRAGDVAFVHPHKALARGCDCVIQMEGGVAMIAIYQRMDPENVWISKLNPALDRKLRRRDVLSIHRIVGAQFAA